MTQDTIGASERTLTHTRQIVCDAYRRRDGLWEIDAHVRDLKAEAVPFRSRPAVAAGTAMHDMRLTFLIDAGGVIRAVQATVAEAPWPACRETPAAYRALVGLAIGRGFRAGVLERVGGVKGCAHLTDLLTQVGNTYMQASWPERVAAQRRIDADPRRWPDPGVLGFVGSCHAWQRDGDALRSEYPELAE